MPMASRQAIWRSLRSARCGPPLRAAYSTRFRRWCAPWYALNSRRSVGSSPTRGRGLAVPDRCSKAGQLRPTASGTGRNVGKLGPIRFQAACPRLRATRRPKPARSLRACQPQTPVRQGPQDQGSGDGPRVADGGPSSRWRSPPRPRRRAQHRQAVAVVNIGMYIPTYIHTYEQESRGGRVSPCDCR